MRICLVYQSEFPDSERIEKTAKSLSSAGHEVFLLSNNYGKFAEHEQQVAAVHVIRLGPTFRGRRVWNKLLKFPIFLNPLWIAALFRVVRRHRIDALQIIDVPLSAAVLVVGRCMGLPVVYDMWENYPEALRGWARKDWKTRVFKNYRVARAVELWVTRRVDHIFTVVEEARERLLSDGIDPKCVSVVTNGVDIDMFLKESNSANDVGAPYGNPESYKMLYGGLVKKCVNEIRRRRPRCVGSLHELR